MGLGFTFEAEDEGLFDYVKTLSESLEGVADKIRLIGAGAPGIREVSEAASEASASIEAASRSLARSNDQAERGGSLWSKLISYMNTKSLLRGATDLSRTVDALGAGLKAPFDQAVKWEQAQRDLNGTIGMSVQDFEKFRKGASELVARTGQGNQVILELGLELSKAGVALTDFGTGAENMTQTGADLASAYKLSSGQVAEFIVNAKALGVTAAGFNELTDSAAGLEKAFKVRGLMQELPGLLSTARENAMKLGKGFGDSGKKVVQFSLAMATAIRKKLNVSMQDAAKYTSEAMGGFTTLQDQFDRMKAGMGDWTDQMDQAVEGMVMAGMSGPEAVQALSTIGWSVESQRSVFQSLAKTYQNAGGEQSAMGVRMRLTAQDLLGVGAAAALTQGKTDEFLTSLDAGLKASAAGAGKFGKAVDESYKGLEQQKGVAASGIEFNKVLAMSQTTIRAMAEGLTKVNEVMAAGMVQQVNTQNAMAQTRLITEQMAKVPVGSARYLELQAELKNVTDQYGAAMAASSAFTFTAADGVSRLGAVASTGPGKSFMDWLKGVVTESPLAATAIAGLGGVVGALGLKLVVFGGYITKFIGWLRGTAPAAEAAAAATGETAAAGSRLAKAWSFVTGIFTKIGAVLPKITGFFGNLFRSVQAGAAVAGSYLSQFAGWFTKLFQAGGKLAGVTSVFGKIGAAAKFAFKKILIPVSLVIAAYDALSQQWDNLVTSFSNFGKVMEAEGGGVSGFLSALLEPLGAVFGVLWDFVDSFTFGIFGKIFDPFVAGVSSAIDAVRWLFGATDEGADTAATKVGMVFGGLYDVLVQPVVDAVKWAWGGVEWLWSKLGSFKKWLDGLWVGALNGVQAFANGIPGFFKGAWATTTGFFKSAWKTVTGFFSGNPIGDWFAGLAPVQYVVEALSNKAESLGKAWDAVTDGVRRLVNYIFKGESPSLIDAFTIPFELLDGAINFVMAPLNMLWGAFKDLGTGILAFFEDPLGAVEGLVAQAVDFVLGIPDMLKGMFAEGAGFFGDLLGFDPAAFIQGFSDGVDFVVTMVTDQFDYVAGLVTGLFDDPVGTVMQVFDDAAQFVMGFPGQIVDFFTSNVIGLGDLLGFDGKAVVQYFAPALQFFRNMPSMILSFVSSIPDKLSGMWASVVTTITGKFMSIVDFFKSLPTLLSDGFTSLTTWVGTQKDALVAKFQGWIDGIKEVFSGIANWIKDKLGLGEGGTLTKLLDKAQAVKDKVAGVVADPVGAVQDAGASLLDKASGALSSAADTLSSGFSSVKSGLGGVADTVTGWLPRFADGGIVSSPTLGFIAEQNTPEAVVPLTTQGISTFVEPVMSRVNVDMAGMGGMFSDFSPKVSASPQVITIGPSGEVTTSTDQASIDALRSVINNVGGMPGQLMEILAGGPEIEMPTSQPAPASVSRLQVNVRGTLHANIPALSRHLYAVIEDEAGGAGMGVSGNG